MKALRRGSVLAVLWLVLMPLLRAEDASRQSSFTPRPAALEPTSAKSLALGAEVRACSTRGSGLVATSGTFFLAEISDKVLASPR